MHEDEGEGDVEDVKETKGGGKGESEMRGDKPKGAPGRGKKRSHSPEGGGVAGSSDIKKHKNAYEISERISISTIGSGADLMQRGK